MNTAVVVVTCKNCGCSRVNRPRGLCWRCYYTFGVREKFPPVSKFGVRGVGHSRGPTPPVPTAARPGSPEKLLVMAERVANGFALWHPHDGLAAAPVSVVTPSRTTRPRWC